MHQQPGSGAVFKNISSGAQSSSVTETLMLINVLELKTNLFGLRSLYDHIYACDIKILPDNSRAVHCINSMGSCRSVDCDKITNQFETALLKGGYGYLVTHPW